MQGTKPLSHLVIAAIHGEYVLDQIVRPEFKEVDNFGNLIGGHDRGRHFHHRPNLHRTHLLSLTFQLHTLLSDDFLRTLDVRNIGYHWQHNIEVTLQRRAHDCPDLNAHYRLVSKPKTNGAQTQRGIALVVAARVALVASQIEQSNDRPLLPGKLGNLAVCSILLLFRQHHTGTSEEKP